MNRREWLVAAGAVFAASGAHAGPKTSDTHAHDAPNANLIDAAADCEKKAQACLTHCLAMLSTGDTSMAVCAATARDTIASAQALQALAAADSKHLKSMARTCAEICRDCDAECRKHQDKMQVCRERGLGPSIAVFEPGFLRVVRAYYDAGALPAGTLVKFYFSAGGYLGGGEPLWGAPPIVEALDLYLAMLGDARISWAVAVLGGSLLDTPIARAALERGGHLRVGIEDDDQGPPNVEQVTEAAQLSASVGRPLASPDTVCTLLGIPA